MHPAEHQSPAPEAVPVRRKTRLGRRIKKRISRMLVAIAVLILPRIYMMYMWLVWKTSRVESIGCHPERLRSHYGRGVVALWHEDVFFAGYAFRAIRPHTLASTADFGELITEILRLCGFQIFRGGSTSGNRKRFTGVLREMIEYMNTHGGVLYGITVDGSTGPAYRMKKGAISIAVACKAPIVIEKTWCRNYLRFFTWDRTIIPLPFNRIVHVFAGPYGPPRNVHDPKVFDAFCGEVEHAMLDLTYYAQSMFGEHNTRNARRNFPPGWQPRGNNPTLILPFKEIMT